MKQKYYMKIQIKRIYTSKIWKENCEEKEMRNKNLSKLTNMKKNTSFREKIHRNCN